MPAMKVTCLSCHSTYNIDASKIPENGAWATCKKCGTRIQVLPERSTETANQTIEIPSPIALTKKSPPPTKQPLKASPREDMNPEEAEYASYIGNKADVYIGKFRKYRKTNGIGYALTWHWPAFFFTYYWFFYRRLYVAGVLFMLLIMTPIVNVLTAVAAGFSANYLYFRHIKSRVDRFKRNYPDLRDRELHKGLAEIGGTSRRAVCIMVLLPILAAVAIPNYVSYRNRARESSRLTHLKKIKAAQEQYREQTGQYARNVKELAGLFNAADDSYLPSYDSVFHSSRQYCFVEPPSDDDTRYMISSYDTEIESLKPAPIPLGAYNRLEDMQKSFFGHLVQKNHKIGDIFYDGFMEIGDETILCYSMRIDGVNGGYCRALEANRYILYNLPDDEATYKGFLKMPVEEKKRFLVHQFRELADYDLNSF